MGYFDYSFERVLQASVLSLSLSLDALAASFAYGCAGTRIPFKSVMIISFVCTAVLGAALSAGQYASRFIPQVVGAVLCFSVLLLIGGIKLYQSCRSDKGTPDTLKGGLTTLKPTQAAILAAALSLDGLAAGFGWALGGANGAVMLGVSLVAHMAAVPLGCLLGRRLSQKTNLNISWVGGVVIIILAFSKLL